MLENTPASSPPATRVKLTSGKSRVTNKPLTRFNGNSRPGRRVRDLYRLHMAALGNPTDGLLQSKCLHAAELQVAVETQRLRAAKGEAVDVHALVKLVNVADRAVERLNALARHLL
jgi:hypothetical protein